VLLRHRQKRSFVDNLSSQRPDNAIALKIVDDLEVLDGHIGDAAEVAIYHEFLADSAQGNLKRADFFTFISTAKRSLADKR
jgi:hypothetical protein